MNYDNNLNNHSNDHVINKIQIKNVKQNKSKQILMRMYHNPNKG